ncbi:MAG: quinone-interacting membrane-bound oxidoreductase complex subunit QmoC [Thermodesulfovibrionales bacterium]
MPEQIAEQIIKPDLNFVKEIIASGGESLKKCYQCSTCTVVCDVTPGETPFPRKEMLYAQWGLKEKLLNNPDVWLCHQCSDCTANCPRGAKPGEVLGAIRKMTIREYSAPRFLACMVADSRYLLLLLALPVIIFLGVILGRGITGIPEGEIVYTKIMPVPAIDTIFVAAAVFAVLSFALGVRRYWTALRDGAKAAPRGGLVEDVTAVVTEFLAHRRFRKCSVTQERSTSHLLVFYAFAGLALTTTWAIVYLYGFHRESPYPQYDPMKIVGNVSALALLFGISLVVAHRLKNAEKAGKGSYFDWLFISVISIIAVTGLLSELLRLGNIAVLAYPVYFIHLVFIFFLFAYAPFSKMAHMVYRTTALVFARQTGRDT